MKTLITGASGQLGKSIKAVFEERELDIVALDRQALDVCNEISLFRELTRIQPKILINCAAWTAVDLAEDCEEEAFKVNSDGVRLMAQQCRLMNIKFVHISSDYVFSGDRNFPWQESDTPAPKSAYGRSKAAGELHMNFVLGNDAFLIRTGWLYSEYFPNFVYKMVDKALYDDGPIQIVSDQIGQPTSATDVANQILSLLQTEASGGTFHATNSGQATWFDLCKEVFILCNSNPDRVQPISSIELGLPAERPSYSVLGHRNWSTHMLPPMRDWRDALRERLPGIIETVRRNYQDA